MNSTRQLETSLEQFQILHTATLRRFGHRTVDLSFPNPQVLHDDVPRRTLAELASRTDPAALRYSPFGGFTTARRQVAQQLGRQHLLRYQYDDVILTPGATAALALTIGELLSPPDHAVIVTPSWMDYPLYLNRHGITYTFAATTGSKHLDLDSIERAWTPRTRALILSNPASPTGVRYHDTELAALAVLLHRLADKIGRLPMLINDETHRDQVYRGGPTTATSHYPCTITTYSYAKAWQMHGERIGYAAVHPDHPDRSRIIASLTAGLRSSGICAPGALAQHLAAALTRFTPPLGPVADLQRHARARLCETGHHVVDADATLFVYLSAPSGDSNADVRWAADRGVLLMPSGLFHEPGHLRLSLNIGGSPLDRALDVLADLSAERGRHA